MSRTYPCDLGVCPYSASTAMSCRDLCGLGVVEETLDFDEYEDEEWDEKEGIR